MLTGAGMKLLVQLKLILTRKESGRHWKAWLGPNGHLTAKSPGVGVAGSCSLPGSLSKGPMPPGQLRNRGQKLSQSWNKAARPPSPFSMPMPIVPKEAAQQPQALPLSGHKGCHLPSPPSRGAPSHFRGLAQAWQGRAKGSPGGKFFYDSPQGIPVSGQREKWRALLASGD